MEILTFPLLNRYSHCLKHGFTTREDEKTAPSPDKIRRELAKLLQIPVSHLAVPSQVHGNNVKIVREGGTFDNTDALITRARGIFLTVNVADCVPIFLFNPKEHYCGIIHAGWRGTAELITEKTVRRVLEEFGGESGDIFAVIGPAIGQCSYQVNSDVADRFSEKVKIKDGNRWRLDIKLENKNQLLKQGLPEENIYLSDLCTACDEKRFYSYRRDGEKAGRMIGFIGLI